MDWKLKFADDEEPLRERLIAKGVPPHVADYAAHIGQAWWYRWLVFALVLSGCFIVLLAWAALETQADQIALAHAKSIGGILYNVNSHFSGGTVGGGSRYDVTLELSLIIGILAWSLLVSPVIGLIGEHSTRIRVANFVFPLVNGRRDPISAWIARKSLGLAAGKSDPDAYIRRLSSWWNVRLGIAATFLALLCTVVAGREIQMHDVFTLDSYVRSPFLPWASTSPRAWNTVSLVEVGCESGTKGTPDRIVYRIHFADGRAVDMGDAKGVGGSWLDRAEQLDARLVDLKIPFKRGPLDDGCLSTWHERLGSEDHEQLAKLLRVGQMRGDPKD